MRIDSNILQFLDTLSLFNATKKISNTYIIIWSHQRLIFGSVARVAIDAQTACTRNAFFLQAQQ